MKRVSVSDLKHSVAKFYLHEPVIVTYHGHPAYVISLMAIAFAGMSASHDST